MQLHDYLESVFVKTTIEKQIKYTVFRDARHQAIQNVMNAYRALCRWLNYPILLGGFVLVKLGFIGVPKEAKELIQKLNADNEAAKQKGQRKSKCSSNGTHRGSAAASLKHFP